ncbi:peroxisome biogenesis factor 2 [Contarinia nasturtii]|uniref:peroxisome biogenesis factor 2 n=1 Tax=Contarinia nasturtii TaxID=265458 RepID=UPI0012D3D9AE|nr:peroxisome biogenesis factor 2 [Contarinia nasturtii]
MKTEFVPRVNQLDALQLDRDIIRIIRNQLIDGVQMIWPGFMNKLSPEVDLLLRAAIWNYSVRLHSATFGQRLLFISYDKNQLMNNANIYKHFFLNVFLKYVRDNITFRWIHRQTLQKCVTYCENVIALCTMLNFFRFLHGGKCPSLVDYILGLDNISMFGNRRREIGYSHMTRELIWGGFMELLGFTLPLINFHYVRRRCRNLLQKFRESSIDTRNDKKPCLNVNTKCAYCNERPTLPYHMGCTHVFCYYCLKGNLLVDSNFECPICQQKKDFFEPL